MTAILPAPLLLDAARIDIPEGRSSPIAATMAMRSGDAEVTADLDFLQTGPQSWDIEVETDAGTLRLSMGGRSEEHTSELQLLMRISYAVFRLKKKKNHTH